MRDLVNFEMRQLGQSEIFVSPVGLGCWPIAGMTSLDVNDGDSLKTVLTAIESGINFLDTAHCYGIDGVSERIVGQAIAERRDDLVIATKGGIHWDQEGVRHYGGRPEKIIEECEESLRRLNLDVIDLYYLHAPDPDVPVSESAGAFTELLEQGKIRCVGVSNLTVPQMQSFQAVCPITAAQPPYNMLQRDIERDVLPWCLQQGISVVTYWPLMKGLLAGKIRRGHAFDPLDKRLTYEIFQGDAFERAQCLLDLLDSIAAEVERTVAQVVVNWTYHQSGILSVLCGAKRGWQIRETAGSLGWCLSESQQRSIEDFLAATNDSTE